MIQKRSPLAIHLHLLVCLILITLLIGEPSSARPLFAQQPPQPDKLAKAQAHLDVGMNFIKQKDFDAALAELEQARQLFHDLGDHVGEAEAWLQIGVSHKQRLEWAEAAAAYTASIQLWTGIADAQYDVAFVENELAFVHYQLGDLDQAAAAAAVALEVASASAFDDQRGQAHLYLGLIARKAEQPQSALYHLEIAFSLLEQERPTSATWLATPIAELIVDLAQYNQARAYYRQALRQYQRALVLYQKVDDQRNVAAMLHDIGTIYHAQANYPAAYEQYDQAQKLCEKLQDVECKVAVENSLGEYYDALGRYAQALQTHQAAYSLCQSPEHCSHHWTAILHHIGRDLFNLGRYTKAHDQLKLALATARQRLDQEQEASILNSLGALYAQQAEYEQAITYYQQAMDRFTAFNSQEGVEATIGNLGDVYHHQGRLPEALAQYQQAYELAQAIGDQVGEATSLGNIGAVREGLGQYDEALRAHRTALHIWESIGNLDGQDVAHDQMGAAYDSLGLYDQAISEYQLAENLARQVTGNPDRLITALNNQGVALVNKGKYKAATPFFTETLTLTQKFDLPALKASTYDNLATVATATGQFTQAIAYHEQARSLRHYIGDHVGEGFSLLNLGIVYLKQAQYDLATAHLNEASVLFDTTGSVAAQVATLGNLGRLYQQQGNLPQAINFYQQAVTHIDHLHAQVKVEKWTAAFLAQQTGWYNDLIDSFIEEKKFVTAFDYAEQARARAFLDHMGNQPLHVRRGISPALLDQELALRREVIGLASAANELRDKARRETEAAVTLQALEEKLKQARQRYAQFLDVIQLESPGYGSLVSVKTVPVAELQTNLLDAETTLIAYFSTATQVVAWVIDKENFQLIRLPVTPDGLIRQVKQMNRFFASKSFDDKTAAELYTSLFAPLRPYIRHSNLLIIPHDVLHYLPFAALRDPDTGQYLVEKYTITYAPSASVLKFIQEKHNPNSNQLLVLGNPDRKTPDTEKQANAIASLFASVAFTGTQASETQFYTGSGAANIIHIAAHGIYVSTSPLYSRIELAADAQNDGYLEAHEIFGLDLPNANLVVLSACDTALGEQSAGDELVGLTRAFLYAGAPAVITTLWLIQSDASATLMVAFYDHLRTGMTKAEALRAAQLEVLTKDKWHSPYYWAAFALTGNTQDH